MTFYLLNLFSLLIQTACTKTERVFVIIKQPSTDMTGTTTRHCIYTLCFVNDKPFYGTTHSKKAFDRKRNTEHYRYLAEILLHVSGPWFKYQLVDWLFWGFFLGGGGVLICWSISHSILYWTPRNSHLQTPPHKFLMNNGDGNAPQQTSIGS